MAIVILNQEENMKNVEKLEKRVVDFTVMVIKISNTLPKTRNVIIYLIK